MPLMRVEPPMPLPRGTAMVRPCVASSGSVSKPQLNDLFVMSLLKPAGMRTQGWRPSPPASRSRTVWRPSAVSRVASLQPAAPPPTRMQAYSVPAVPPDCLLTCISLLPTSCDAAAQHELTHQVGLTIQHVAPQVDGATVFLCGLQQGRHLRLHDDFGNEQTRPQLRCSD